MKKIFIYAAITTFLIIAIIKAALWYKSNQLNDGLILQASREAPIGGIWLGLYNDHHFNFGYFGLWDIDIEATGTYQIKGDTLLLKANRETENVIFKNLRFLILKGALMELPKDSSGIGYLEIWKNPLYK